MSEQDLLKTNPEDGENDTNKTDKELMDEIIFLLDNASAETLDTDAVRAKLSVIDERDPAEEKFDPEKEWKAFIEANPFDANDEAKTDGAEAQPVRRRKGILTVLRVFEVAVVLAAALVLFSGAANESPIDTIVRWTGDLFLANANRSGELELPANCESEYHSLREALDKNGAQDALCPTWIPERFVLESVEVKTAKARKMFIAIYKDNADEIVISISMRDSVWIKNMLETTEDTYVEEIINGDTFYVLSNIDCSTVFCSKDGYGYNILCDTSREEMILLMESLYK